jgi:RND family efflux transporter MFP subunit
MKECIFKRQYNIIKNNNMWFKSKKQLIISIIVIIVLIIIGFTVFGGKKASLYETVKVEKGDLAQTVDASGKIQSAQDLSLHFETIGKVSRVYVKEGDEVKAGQWIANLSLTELNSAVAQAEATLNQRLAGATPEQIAVSQKQVDSAQVALDQANKTLEETKDLAQKNLTAKYSYAQTTLDDAYIKIYNAYNTVNILQRTYFSSNTQESLRVKAEFKYNIEDPMNAVKTYIDSAKTEDQIELAVSKMTTTLNQVLGALTVIREICSNTSYDSTISSADKTNLDLQKSYISTVQTSVSSLGSEINILKTTNQKNISVAESGVATAKVALEVQKASYNSLTATPREVDVAYYRAVLDQAKANRNKAIIYAPIDGIVTKINKKEGESISTAEAMIEMLSPHYEIDVDIPETDVVKISLNDDAEITLDALGKDVKFMGKIINIDPASTDIQGVVYYKVKVSLIDNNDIRVKSGMTANVVVNTDSRTNILYLPSRAVLSKDGDQKYVRVLVNNQITEKDVVLGMKGDNGIIEIVSGVNQGDEIVLKSLK